MAATTQELLRAYRGLLRAGLRAVQFSEPSSSTFRERLREGFRDPSGAFSRERVRRTIWFLNAAAQERGLEHRILKNLCRVHWQRGRDLQRTPWRVKIRLELESKRNKGPDLIRGTEFEHYERTIAMLNDSLTLCLR
ncbi:DUF1763-domain-containing protein [Parathielavia hyrcaniae]|uniref:DUF1763-domain-containing protein n=1 Tax=Parathielavia hyrcaniae TaxID=113614 RepID=A0AAN6Q3B1_9PEZI|nr:DUF1763-domain-containing protein [Parathielavia hyrcaniae]